jgi:hypothetical protein
MLPSHGEAANLSEYCSVAGAIYCMPPFFKNAVTGGLSEGSRTEGILSSYMILLWESQLASARSPKYSVILPSSQKLQRFS